MADPARPLGRDKAPMLSADELLAGSSLEFEVTIPSEILDASGEGAAGTVRLRPLTVRDLQLVTRAAKDNDSMASALMVQSSLVEPKLTVPQVAGMQVGLLEFLLDEVNRISGIGVGKQELDALAQEPLLRAAHLLAKEFGWTPEQVSALTIGQLSVQLQLLRDERGARG